MVRAIFIGGPKHGQQEEMIETPDRIWVEDEGGTKTLYEWRSELSYGVGDRAMKPYETWYAPVGMSDDEMRKLEAELKDRDID